MSTTTLPSTDEVWRWLGEVPDPEIPVISLTELGIIRDVGYDDGTLVVTVTPTYSGCPATSVINFEIEAKLRERGLQDFRLERQLSPAWTTDWITEEGREKLRAYGIAPPEGKTGGKMALFGETSVHCPRCNSTDTEKLSEFGSTACKAQYRCLNCAEPFDYFKCI